MRARVEAFVDKMLFTEGTEVKEGDPLFKLDDKPFQERLAAAKGRLAEAKAALNKYEADVARLKPLAEKRAVPQQDLDNAVASVDVGKASVLSAQARVESAELDLGYCDVRAPIDRADRRQAGVHRRTGGQRRSRRCWPRSPRSIRSGSTATSAKWSILEARSETPPHGQAGRGRCR